MATIQVRIDEKLKQDAKKVFEKMGLDMSSAIKLFFRQTARVQGLPFRPVTENGLTPWEEEEILRASEEAKQGINTVSFDNIEDAIAYLHQEEEYED